MKKAKITSTKEKKTNEIDLKSRVWMALSVRLGKGQGRGSHIPGLQTPGKARPHCFLSLGLGTKYASFLCFFPHLLCSVFLDFPIIFCVYILFLIIFQAWVFFQMSLRDLSVPLTCP